jgi:SAM-dependent methyltransferase
MTNEPEATIFKEFPLEFDPEFYRRSYADLAPMSDIELRDHYFRYGIQEGRMASPAATRENFLALVSSTGRVLEIGPFCAPCLVGDYVRYFDVLDKAGLITRAKSIGIDHSRVPNIDYISSVGDLSVVPGRFDAVFSSHCIEHQPDLISHLNGVARLLRTNGLYFLTIPDKRYCFDRFVRESTIADVIDANLSRRTVHTAKSVIEHRALTTHNDPLRHWQGDHGTPFTTAQSQKVADAIKEINSSHGGYIDVHAWQFTPETFRTIIEAISRVELTPMRPLRIYGTPFGRFEFCAILYRS